MVNHEDNPQILIAELREEKKNQLTMIRMLSVALVLFILTGGYSYYITNKYDEIVRELAEALHNQREQFLDCIDANRIPPHVNCEVLVSPRPNEIIEDVDSFHD